MGQPHIFPFSVSSATTRLATAADRVQTGLDRAAIAADVIAVEADRAEVSINTALAQSYRDEAAVYAGAAYLTDYYETTVAGLAGTTSGQYFGVPSTAGVSIYRNTAGVAVLQFVHPSLDAMGKLGKVIWCTTTVTGLNSFDITPTDPNVRYLGTGQLYLWAFQHPQSNTNGSGSVSITVKDGAGTTFFASALHRLGNIPPAIGAFSTGDFTLCRRQTAAEDPVGQRLLSLEFPSEVKDIAPWMFSSSNWGHNPSPDRPIIYTKADTNVHLIDMRPHTTLGYSGSVTKRHSDRIRIVDFDMTDFMSDTGNALALNSVFTRYAGRECEDLNLLFTAVNRGFTVDTGTTPTTIECPLEGGKFGDAAALYVTAGWGHGYVQSPTTQIKTYLNEPSTSTIVAATKANPLVLSLQSLGLNTHQFVVGDVIIPRGVTGMTEIDGVELTVTAVSTATVTIGAVNSTAYGVFIANTGGIDLVSTINPDAVIGTKANVTAMKQTETALFENAAGDIYCKTTYVKTYDPRLANQIRIETTFDFAHASVTVTPGLKRGFGMLWAGTDMNRCQAIVNGVVQATQTIDTRDNTGIILGYPEKVYFWHSDFPQKQIIVTNNFGYGFSHKENGVLSTAGSPTYVQSFPWGWKIYGGLFGDHSATPVLRNMTGIAVTLDMSVAVLYADPR